MIKELRMIAESLWPRQGNDSLENESFPVQRSEFQRSNLCHLRNLRMEFSKRANPQITQIRVSENGER